MVTKKIIAFLLFTSLGLFSIIRANAVKEKYNDLQ